MATYTELYNLRNNPGVVNKVTTAVSIKAHSILGEASPSTERKTWAEEAINDPKSKTNGLMWYLLADNKDATSSTIEGASDSTIQTAVDNAVDKLRP